MAYKRISPQPVVEGGTGSQSNTAYAVLCGGTTATGALQSIASVGTSGQVLTSNGAGTLPTFQSASGGVIVTTFTSSDTWNKNANTKHITIMGWSGGGAGGSGRRGVSTNAGGGGGGGSSGFFQISSPASFFNSSETVTIGAGAGITAGQTVDNNNGNPGASGGVTTFGSIYLNPGVGGNAGTTGNAAARASSQCLVNYTTAAATINSGTGTLTAGGSGATATAIISSAIGTGGGGGSGADAVTPRQAGNGGLIQNSFTTLLAGGAGGIETGTINGAPGNNQLSTGGVILGGTGGGGGGGQSTGLVAGNGGTGGFPGGGGGGGGGSINGTTSGAGGAGGNGYVIIIEFT